ncbi:Creatinase/aminopeptidase [Sistotremastrum niveocremeum HHB9708]|uniref:Creatinase/aminopeptidase n=1 Tax=Sistotremastrum niveocremeum HHB9708 TaxID=1314777 RepID=A0A165A0G0_9AGAM|nr:Creatinase/aminopeptidase [Sistotremastrum niveocremeum HHB9708]
MSADHESTSTLVGSSLDRKIADAAIPETPRVDTGPRLAELRKLMVKEGLDYYIVPSEDAHQSEYVAANERRRAWITGFTGSAGTALISLNNAYLFTDSRYWAQATRELDKNWVLQRVGWEGQENWRDYIIRRSKNTKIGVDSRLISYEVALDFYTRLKPRDSRLVYPRQNLVDLLWTDKPTRPKDPIFIQPIKFAGQDAKEKLKEVRAWLRAQAAEQAPPKAGEQVQKITATVICSLASIAWLLNLRGTDVPFNPVFQAYLFVGLEQTVLFIESAKVTPDVGAYLKSLHVTIKDYNDLWGYLRKWEWGDGKVVLIPSSTPYSVALMLGSSRYAIAPAFIDDRKALKNQTEIEGFEQAYLRDGVAFVRWFAWLEEKFNEGFAITEYEAAYRLTEYRRQNANFMGLAYENISASGANAALPHYSPTRHGAKMIDRVTPYLIDSGGQYLDGTCDTTRTVHFGHPTQEQCEAYTRVLQGHIAIDSAIFPEGTTGGQLDILARKALWSDGLNYLHGTGHGFGSFLNVHEGPQGLGTGNNVPLKPGHVLTNEPGYYYEGHWGIRIESALVVRRVQTKGNFQGDVWLGFKRFTQVPIQTKMVRASMLSKEEKQWIKAGGSSSDHNEECRRNLEPLLKDDKRALKWLRRQAERGLGAEPGPGGIHIDWG